VCSAVANSVRVGTTPTNVGGLPRGNQVIKSPPTRSPTVMCVSVCLSDPVSNSLVQSVMSLDSSHSQHSHISTDTMSSMSGSYLAGAEGEPGGDEGGVAEGEENQDAPMESRGPSQQDGVRNLGMDEKIGFKIQKC